VSLQAPASGRLAAAISTSSDRRRFRRDDEKHRNKPIRRIADLLLAPEQTKARSDGAEGKMVRSAGDCRDVAENSDTAAADGTLDGMFVATKMAAAAEIFSTDLRAPGPVTAG
jgi:hypothetical protein